MSDPDRWELWAARLNSFRVVPRILIMVYYLFFIKAWFYVVDWFTGYDWGSVENQAVALALAGFPATILGIISAILASLTNNYFRTGGSGK